MISIALLGTGYSITSASFVRVHQNSYYIASDGFAVFAAEDFIDRYSNVAIAGFDYRWFVKRKFKWAPFRLNTRIYSCILIQNDIPFRCVVVTMMTDLSLRALSKTVGVLFCFLHLHSEKQRNPHDDERRQYRRAIQTRRAEDRRLLMAQSLQQHIRRDENCSQVGQMAAP